MKPAEVGAAGALDAKATVDGTVEFMVTAGWLPGAAAVAVVVVAADGEGFDRGMEGAEAECWSGIKSAGGGGGASWGGGGITTCGEEGCCCCSCCGCCCLLLLCCCLCC